MQINKVRPIYFSPTQTSQKIVEAIGSGMTMGSVNSVNLTSPNFEHTTQMGSDEVAIIGVPVYAGRVAPIAVNRFYEIRGNNTPAIIVVLYGNREYEDALIELKDLALQNSFIPVGAAAFIGEHSFSSDDTPIAAGRPDAADLAVAKDFGARIFAKLSSAIDISSIETIAVPGNSTYKEGMGPLPFTPKVDHSMCTVCGECVVTCPTGAITMENEIVMESGLCVFCCACIKNCPEEAVSIDAAPLQEKKQWLFENCKTRKEPSLFL